MNQINLWCFVFHSHYYIMSLFIDVSRKNQDQTSFTRANDQITSYSKWDQDQLLIYIIFWSRFSFDTDKKNEINFWSRPLVDLDQFLIWINFWYPRVCLSFSDPDQFLTQINLIISWRRIKIRQVLEKQMFKLQDTPSGIEINCWSISFFDLDLVLIQI